MIDLVPTQLVLAYMAVLGAVLGSFANVVVARLPEGESVVRPRSRCPACKSPIAWYDNVPLLSWLLLRARCRRCGARISPRYFLVELIMAGLTAALWVRFGWSFELLVWIPLTTALVIIAFLDIDHWWVPDVITLPGIALVGVASFLPGGSSPVEALLGLLPALLIWVVAWVFERASGKEGLGFGDVKLLALVGLALGLSGGLGVLVLASLQGSAVGILVLLTGGHRGVDAQEEAVAAGGAAPSDAREAESGRGAGDEHAAGHAAVATDAGDDEDHWVPHPRAIPFGPFLVLGALEVVLLPSVFGALPERVSELVLRYVG